MPFSLAYSFVITPPVLIAGCLAAALLALWRPRAGVRLMILSSALLYLSATPLVSAVLLEWLEDRIPTESSPGDAQAIVVLGGDVISNTRSGRPGALGLLSLQRVAYAARLYREVGLPIVVSGGYVESSVSPIADLMREELERNFNVPVRWVERQSRTTFENAEFSAALLKPEGITTVFVVTQAWHMPRALWSFEHAGLHAVARPAPSAAPRTLRINDFLPSARSFHNTSYAVHELLGLAYYKLRYSHYRD